MTFKTTPVSDYLSKDQIVELQRYYTDFEKVAPGDLYISEPSMQGASDIQQSMASGNVAYNVVLQEMILTKDREQAWSRKFLEKAPARCLMSLGMVCMSKVADLFVEYQKQAEEALKGEKKPE